jgi:hypothetical protein
MVSLRRAPPPPHLNAPVNNAPRINTLNLDPIETGLYSTDAAATSVSRCKPCEVGNSCIQGVKTPCAAGSYASSPGATLCSPCPAGRYGSTTGLSSSNCTGICAAGRYGDAGAPTSLCTGACLPGYFGGSVTLRISSVCDGQCTAGYLGNLDGQTSPSCVSPCPLGAYCQTGSSFATPCPAGRYGAAPALVSLSRCTPCTVGRYSTALGASSDSTCLPCDAGLISNTGATSCSTCPVGSYCVLADGNVTVARCPRGTWSGAEGATDASTCLPCGAGTFSEIEGASQVTFCKPCPGK